MSEIRKSEASGFIILVCGVSLLFSHGTQPIMHLVSPIISFAHSMSWILENKIASIDEKSLLIFLIVLNIIGFMDSHSEKKN